MKLPESEIHKIAVFRALQLGDMLCSIPAIRALRLAYPNATISLIGLPWARSFVKRFNLYFDRFIEFPGFPGLPEQEYDPTTVSDFIREMQAEKFDLVIQMQGNGSYVNPLTELFNGKYLAGFYRPEDYCPDKNLFIIYPDYGSEINRHLMLMKHIGLSSDNNHLEFLLNNEDLHDYESIALDVTVNKYVCVHPGSRGAWRQWPPEHFAVIADYCYQQGFSVVLTGTESERSLTEKVRGLMKCPAIDLSGKTSLGAIGVLIKGAALLISNCTGVSHIASALETPSIVISMDGEPERWAPLNTSIHKTTNWLQNAVFEKVMNDTKLLLMNRRVHHGSSRKP